MEVDEGSSISLVENMDGAHGRPEGFLAIGSLLIDLSFADSSLESLRHLLFLE